MQAHLAALMPYRVAADVLRQVCPVDAGKHVETFRRHTLKCVFRPIPAPDFDANQPVIPTESSH